MKKAFVLLLLTSLGVNAQGLINSILQADPNGPASPQCGAHHALMDHDHKLPGFKEASDQAFKAILQQQPKNQKTASATLTIPVVFHIVYNDTTKNIPDSVIYQQLDALNANFSRQNADTSTLRPDFLPYAGNPRIRFELATVDPDGNPSTGIVRRTTNISHFGGILPYSQNQTAQIQQWVADSLMYNFSRICADSLGGSDPWDIERYMNIWIGDMRIFEPLVNNFEEITFLGLARPVANHPSFAGTGVDSLPITPGAIMHYMAIGPNNPRAFPPPYGAFNTISNEGDLLSHEAGHFLGLRHIWGDGNCSADDFIDDTPLSNNSNQFTCNKQRNTCVDSIGGLNLPDMVENFMDYSSDACLNSFTHQQAQAMRATLFNFYPNLFTIGQKEPRLAQMACYPNPSNGLINLEAPAAEEDYSVKVYNLSGSQIMDLKMPSTGKLSFQLEGQKGIYFIVVGNSKQQESFKVLKQ